MLWKCCTQYASKFGKQWPQEQKRLVFIPIQMKGNAKECSNYYTIALTSYARKVMPQILQVGLQQYVNCELPDVQTGLRKGRWARGQIANIHWIMEKVKEFQKSIYLCFINDTKAFDCVDHNKRGKFLKRWAFQTLLLVSWETFMWVKKQQLEPDIKQRTGSKLGKEYITAVYCQLALLLMFSCSVVSNSLRPHGLQHARLPCPSPSPGACSNSCLLSWWCHPTISFSVFPFSSCLQSFPASGSFPMSQLFASGGQSIGASASASVLPKNIQDWFPLGLPDHEGDVILGVGAVYRRFS